MFNPENVEHSVELPIGTRFYFRDTLLEVAESEDGKAWYCAKCVLGARDEAELCQIMNCNYCRRDDKYTYFKEVKEMEEQHNNGRIYVCRFNRKSGNSGFREPCRKRSLFQ